MKCKRCAHYPYDGFTGEIRHFDDDLIEGCCEMGISENDQNYMGPYASNSCPYFEEHFIETCLTCKYFIPRKMEKDLENGIIGVCTRYANLFSFTKELTGITPCPEYLRKARDQK